MVYTRKNKKTYSKAKATKAMYNIAKQVVKKNQEQKIMFGDLTAYNSVATTWIETVLSAPLQGVDKQNRIGNKVGITSIEVYGTLCQASYGAALDDPYNTIRIVLGQWSAAASAAPCASVGLGLNMPLRTNLNCLSMLQKKMYDKYIALQVASTERGAGDGYAPEVKTFKLYKKFKTPIPIQFGDNNNTRPDKRLVLSMISDSGTAPNVGFVGGYWVVTFVDM